MQAWTRGAAGAWRYRAAAMPPRGLAGRRRRRQRSVAGRCVEHDGERRAVAVAATAVAAVGRRPASLARPSLGGRRAEAARGDAAAICVLFALHNIYIYILVRSGWTRRPAGRRLASTARPSRVGRCTEAGRGEAAICIPALHILYIGEVGVGQTPCWRRPTSRARPPLGGRCAQAERGQATIT